MSESSEKSQEDLPGFCGDKDPLSSLDHGDLVTPLWRGLRPGAGVLLYVNLLHHGPVLEPFAPVHSDHI